MNLRFIDWIWRVRGSLILAPEQSEDEAFDRLDPLFRTTGTTHQRTEGELKFSKKDQAAQDKMSVFDSGVLRIDRSAGTPALRYQMTSRALLFCFLSPLLFLAIAQLTISLNKLDKPPQHAEKKHAPAVMNPIDKALGAPAPDDPNKKGAKSSEDPDKKPSPTPAYILAAMFAILYVFGRILEDRMVRRLFRKTLQETG